MGLNSVGFALRLFSTLAITGAVNNSNFEFYPDRDNIKFFSLRIPISVVFSNVPDVLERAARGAVSSGEPDSINVKIENDQGYICAEERDTYNLEISGLPCDQCMTSKLLVRVETKKENKILSKFRTILAGESKRAEICSLKPESRKQGEDLVVTSPKQNPEDGCLLVFRDADFSIGCCFSNRDFYTQDGGCDPNMQSSSCRKGSERPILEEEENSCTFRINNLRPADSGNYLSKFQYTTPGYKKVLLVEGEFSITDILIICLTSLSLLAVLTVIILTKKRQIFYNLVKENQIKILSQEKPAKAELIQDRLETLSPLDHVA